MAAGPGAGEPPGPGPEGPGPEEPPGLEGPGPGGAAPEEPPGPGPGQPVPEQPGPGEPGAEGRGPGGPEPEEPPGPEEPGRGEPAPKEPPGPGPEPATAGSEVPAEPPGPAAPPSPAASGAAPGPSEQEEEAEEERRERAALLAEHRGLASERERLRPAGALLQLRLGELLRLRKGERAAAGGGRQAAAYGERLRELSELRGRRERAEAACGQRLSARSGRCRESEARAGEQWAAFQESKKALALRALGRRLAGREEAVKAVDCVLAKEQVKERALREVRVENIKVKLEIQNLEAALKAQGELLKGRRFTDFEYVKKENQKLSEKFDDLCGEILKLKKKVSTAVHVLSQHREKLQFVEAENQVRKAELMDIETLLSQKRDFLTSKKKARDRLRANTLKLQQKRGLLANEILLQDFEEKVDTLELLRQQLETLKRYHADLILTRREIQKKVREANSFLPY